MPLLSFPLRPFSQPQTSASQQLAADTRLPQPAFVSPPTYASYWRQSILETARSRAFELLARSGGHAFLDGVIVIL